MNFSLMQVSSFPVSVRIAFSPRKFRVNISRKDREIQRFRDEANDFYDQKLKGLKAEEKKNLATKWIKEKMIDKSKKVEVVEFGDVVGKGKFALTLFMLVQIGLLEEDKEKKKKEDDEKLKKKKKEDEKARKEKEDEEKARKEKENEEYENYYEEITQQEKAKKEKKDEEALLLYVALWWTLTK